MRAGCVKRQLGHFVQRCSIASSVAPSAPRCRLDPQGGPRALLPQNQLRRAELWRKGNFDAERPFLPQTLSRIGASTSRCDGTGCGGSYDRAGLFGGQVYGPGSKPNGGDGASKDASLSPDASLFHHLSPSQSGGLRVDLPLVRDKLRSCGVPDVPVLQCAAQPASSRRQSRRARGIEGLQAEMEIQNRRMDTAETRLQRWRALLDDELVRGERSRSEFADSSPTTPRRIHRDVGWRGPASVCI